MEWVETTGRTVEEAKDARPRPAGVDEDDAEFEVLEEPRPGLFGRIRGEAGCGPGCARRSPGPRSSAATRRRAPGGAKADAEATETSDQAEDVGDGRHRRRPGRRRRRRAGQEGADGERAGEARPRDESNAAEQASAAPPRRSCWVWSRRFGGSASAEVDLGRRRRGRGAARRRRPRPADRPAGPDPPGGPGPDPHRRAAPRRRPRTAGCASTSAATGSAGGRR